jgi:ATP-dependent Clp protease ATP-binding subunit ClpC
MARIFYEVVRSCQYEGVRRLARTASSRRRRAAAPIPAAAAALPFATMFERFTERARRVLFFARYEVSQLGGVSIETEHLLLGLVREGKGLTSQIFTRAGVALDAVRADIEQQAVFHEKIPTSADIPFSAAARRVLEAATEEANRLRHDYIGTEHLLLGLLRDDTTVACRLLNEHGLRLDAIREEASGKSDRG